MGSTTTSDKNLLRAEVRRVSVKDDLEPLQCVHLRIQGTGSNPTVQDHSEAGRIPGSPVLSVILAHGAVSTRPPLF
jgi:hypothetical protein